MLMHFGALLSVPAAAALRLSTKETARKHIDFLSAITSAVPISNRGGPIALRSKKHRQAAEALAGQIVFIIRRGMPFAAAAAGLAAFEMHSRHDYFVAATAATGPAHTLVLVVFHSAQGGQFPKLPASEIFGLTLGSVLLWNASAVCDITAHKLTSGGQRLAPAVTFTMPAYDAAVRP